MTEDRLHISTSMLAILGVLFAASVVLLVTQLFLGATDPDNWFSRVMVAGMGGIFTTALLVWITKASSWSVVARATSAAVNLVLSVILLLVLTTVVWMAF
ncbi:putative Tic20 family protein [Microbacterium halimionae]|uniref:Putative Tic20 family protein n=1 Tax=Microbacterium halimionae TaxID=1526413 RepID=A0A7W3JNL9_9MICO|nr:hypothetical protein [Microbacterium halimionae]MBA8816172.1 putative Tic20 family protein [Microbacterium halimionae]NII96374.1 putative Tic20 family protein [Microbacterium halimionae]